MSQISIPKKYGVSRESIRKWHKSRASIEEHIRILNMRDKKKKRANPFGPLSRIVCGLHEIYELNHNTSKDLKISITSAYNNNLNL